MEIFGKILGWLIILMVFVLLLTLPVWLLWNWLMPVIFGLPEVSIAQAFGLMLLASILFKSSSN